MARAIVRGDYVLATKWGDGDPQDGWCVGFYVEERWPDWHIVVDGEGKEFRANGFRRVAHISQKRGAWILAHADAIEVGNRSLWGWARAKMTEGG